MSEEQLKKLEALQEQLSRIQRENELLKDAVQSMNKLISYNLERDKNELL